MPLHLGLTAAALLVSLHVGPFTNLRQPAPTAAVVDDELRARVEIGPSVLRIYGADGKVTVVE